MDTNYFSVLWVKLPINQMSRSDTVWMLFNLILFLLVIILDKPYIVYMSIFMATIRSSLCKDE